MEECYLNIQNTDKLTSLERVVLTLQHKEVML